MDVRYLFLFVCLIISLACNTPTPETQAQPPAITDAGPPPTFPAPQGFISDFDSLLTTEQVTTIDARLEGYADATGHQIAVVTVADLAPYNEPLTYAVEIGKAWGVGDAVRNDGLVMVVCHPLNKAAIATGSGTELILTDSICSMILREELFPRFREGDYYGGIRQGIEKLISRWR